MDLCAIEFEDDEEEPRISSDITDLDPDTCVTHCTARLRTAATLQSIVRRAQCTARELLSLPVSGHCPLSSSCLWPLPFILFLSMGHCPLSSFCLWPLPFILFLSLATALYPLPVYGPLPFIPFVRRVHPYLSA